MLHLIENILVMTKSHEFNEIKGRKEALRFYNTNGSIQRPQQLHRETRT